MRIYTRRGDEGQTDLREGKRVSKTSPRIETYGTVDELNALLGRVRPTGYDDLDDSLGEVQNHLHIIQADLANPDPEEDDPVIRDVHVETLEDWVDELDEELEALTSFVLPGGSESGASVHHARAVCRRAERRAVALASAEDINDGVLTYLNRLSDALFVIARALNQREGVPEESPTY